ncbi:hypothetical protein GCM10010145_47990 [Streptomyces ruber]|uniref:Uncharacterized protein n=2 Tax=Streptomyces TaxID=1883 RepID=A0A918EU25_9ACTN|nr:hypothetical protein GCM10010145_47990 [Streptomyces ruber]
MGNGRDGAAAGSAAGRAMGVVAVSDREYICWRGHAGRRCREGSRLLHCSPRDGKAAGWGRAED